MRIVITQLNFTVGDIAGNIEKITSSYKKAVRSKADLVVFSEMAITGYPPEDLVLRKSFQEAAMQAVEKLAELTGKKGTAILVGGIWREENTVYNAAFLLDGGEIHHRQYKHCLPNYGVFDEKRLFTAGHLPSPANWRRKKLGILICEDMWEPAAARNLQKKGAELLIVINASPYDFEKQEARLENARARVKENKLPLIYANQTGGQDEVVFDGNSFVLSAQGELTAQFHGFEEDSAVFELKGKSITTSRRDIRPSLAPYDGDTILRDIYHAMMLGLRDYVHKNRFPGVLLGLSGGIDSALTAAIAVDALGPEAVHAVMLPSPYTSRASMEDAAECAKKLRIRLDTVSISSAMLAFDKMLGPLFSGRQPDLTEENIQSRLRGNALMAISNKFGNLLITTGNKSEMAVGYATLYGDMCGAYNVLKDIYKTTIYKLANWRNRQNTVIPKRIITKPPSAELRPNQTDQDSLPPYDLLDAILQRFIEQQMSSKEIIAEGFDKTMVERVAKMFYRSEFKRRQAPPGVKITPMSFGRDRRYPLASGWNR